MTERDFPQTPAEIDTVDSERRGVFGLIDDMPNWAKATVAAAGLAAVAACGPAEAKADSPTATHQTDPGTPSLNSSPVSPSEAQPSDSATPTERKTPKPRQALAGHVLFDTSGNVTKWPDISQNDLDSQVARQRLYGKFANPMLALKSDKPDKEDTQAALYPLVATDLKVSGLIDWDMRQKVAKNSDEASDWLSHSRFDSTDSEADYALQLNNANIKLANLLTSQHQFDDPKVAKLAKSYMANCDLTPDSYLTGDKLQTYIDNQDVKGLYNSLTGWCHIPDTQIFSLDKMAYRHYVQKLEAAKNKSWTNVHDDMIDAEFNNLLNGMYAIGVLDPQEAFDDPSTAEDESNVIALNNIRQDLTNSQSAFYDNALKSLKQDQQSLEQVANDPANYSRIKDMDVQLIDVQAKRFGDPAGNNGVVALTFNRQTTYDFYKTGQTQEVDNVVTYIVTTPPVLNAEMDGALYGLLGGNSIFVTELSTSVQ